MSEEEGGNTPPNQEEEGVTPQQGQEPEKKAPDQNPLFPEAAGKVPTGADEPEEELDPRIAEVRNDPSYKKFMEDAGTPEIAYKRWMDSSKEAKRLTEERETLTKHESTLKAVKRDFDIMAQMNPDLYKQVVDLFQKLEGGETPTVNTPSNPAQPEPMSEEKMRYMVELQTTLSDFKRDYKEIIGDNDDDLKRIREYAANMSNVRNRDGKQFSYREALLAALEYYHPEVTRDEAKMEAMASIEQRSSASEPGNAPSGSPSKGRVTPLTQQEKIVAQQFGMSEAEYRKYQTE